MNEPKKVKIVLGKDGSVKTEAIGFKGGTCEQATEFLDNLFGTEGRKRKFKDSYYEQEETIVENLPSGWCG